MHRNAIWIALFALLIIGTNCARRTTQDEPQQETTLEVDNQAGLDMTIYVVTDAGARTRLGTAIAHVRSWFRIPDRLIFGLTPLRFQADPIGGNRAPVSQQITVQPGDTVVLRIPPG
ncbi:MAG: hypothetical protein ACREL7_08970 [Longimicrobiales bacterium]